MNQFEVIIYQNPNGKSSYLKWYSGLSEAVKNKVRDRLFRVKYGNLGDFKPLGNGLYELRFFIGPGYRVYFGKDGLKLIVLLSGGDKSGQSKDIKAAQKLWVEYLEAKNES